MEIVTDRVSILMPVYNEERYICEAIDSVLDQRYSNWELIIVDDFSTDNTYNILLENYSGLEKVIFVRNITKGKNEALNYAYSLSTGGTIIFFAGDDILTSNSVELRVVEDISKPLIKSGKVKSFSQNQRYDNVIYPKGDHPNMSGGATAFSRAAADLIFPIPNILPNEDSWTKLHIDFLKFPIEWTNEVVILYRIHSDNSMGFDSTFDVRSENISKRSHSLNLFLNKYYNSLSKSDVFRLESMINLEVLRRNGSFIKIIFLRNTKWKEKVIGISYSNCFFYSLRIFLNRFLAGRL